MNQFDFGQEDMEMNNARNEVRNAGKRLDFEIETAMSMELPQGRFGETMLNRLVDALNKFGPMMEFENLPKVSGEQSQFPMELAQMIMAITSAADDAGMPLDIDLSEIEADRDLAALIGQLETLVKNEQFKKFLSEELFGEADEEVVENEVEEGAIDDEVVVDDETEDLDEMFARRV